MSWTKTYFNIALLPLAVLSSFPELGGIYMKAMSHKGNQSALDVIRAGFKTLSKENLSELAKTIGMIQDDMVEHVLSGDTVGGYMTAGAQRVNNAFFRAIQMKRWTDFTRTMALTVARDSIQNLGRRATNGDAKAKKELLQYGLTPDQVMNWIQHPDRAPHSSITSALHTWVDHAVIRPSAAMRPAWGSDHRMALVWYLMDFMWGFYETTMKVTGHAMSNNRGLMRLAPMLALGAVMMPLAAAGYELRKLLVNDMPAEALGISSAARQLEGMDYMWEIFQRSGITGPAQKLIEYDKEDERGKLAVLSLLGPIINSGITFLDKGAGDWVSQYAPVMSASPTLRRAYGPSIKHALSFGGGEED